jgi:hypothetical protein
VATVVTEGAVPISSVATSDAAPAKVIVIPMSPSRAASPAALVVDQSPPLITEIGESSRPATSTTKEEVMEAPPLWLVPVVSVQAFVHLDLDGDAELAARRLLERGLHLVDMAQRQSERAMENLGIHPGYSCKEGRRVEDRLLLEFPCTPTRTRFV